MAIAAMYRSGPQVVCRYRNSTLSIEPRGQSVCRVIPSGVHFAHSVVEIVPVGECACHDRQSDGTRRAWRIHLVRWNERHHGGAATCNDNPLPGTNPSDQFAEVSLGLGNAIAGDSVCHVIQSAESWNFVSPRRHGAELVDEARQGVHGIEREGEQLQGDGL